MPVHPDSPEPAVRSTPEAVGPDIAGLLARSARGDEGAWRALIGLYGRRVFAMARSRCRRDDLAEEITQSVFVTIASKLGHGGYSERGRFESWLFRVTMNRVRDEVRREHRHARPTDPAAFTGSVAAPDRRGADEQDLTMLRGAVDSLDDADREVVELRHHGGLSFKQIAEMLGEPMGTVLARHHRALRKIRACIEGWEVGTKRAGGEA